LYSGQPDIVSFETRLTKLWKTQNNKKIIPEFDLRRGRGRGCNVKKNNNENESSLSQEYDAVVLALPPKDIIKFFHSNSNHRHDPQSQADLHRHYNKDNNNNNKRGRNDNDNYLPLTLDRQTINKLRSIDYVGRYSLALWFSDKSNGIEFAQNVSNNWQRIQAGQQQQQVTSVIDAIFLQGGNSGNALVVQSTVDLWRKYSGVNARGGRGGGNQKNVKSAGNSMGNIASGGRQAVKRILMKALEDLYDGGNNGNNGSRGQSMSKKIPEANHAKLLNWRTSQVNIPLMAMMQHQQEGKKLQEGNKKIHDNNIQNTNQKENQVQGNGLEIVSTEDGKVIMTGDWCTESSFEGCYRAALATSNLVLDELERKSSNN